MDTPEISTKQNIYYERLLLQTGIKECTHEYSQVGYCIVCRDRIE